MLADKAWRLLQIKAVKMSAFHRSNTKEYTSEAKQAHRCRQPRQKEPQVVSENGERRAHRAPPT